MSKQSQRYAAALVRLEANDRDAYRAVLSRVKSLQTIANKWRDAAEGKPMHPTAGEWKRKHDNGQHIIGVLERKLQTAEDQLLIAQVELARLTRGDSPCR